MIAMRIRGLDDVQEVFRRMGRAISGGGMQEAVGAEVESQTRRRLHEEKTDPDGATWQEWSESYAASKHGSTAHQPHPGQTSEAGGHSIGVLTGAMLDSIEYIESGKDVEVGSSMEYAPFFHARRPLFGLSEENKQEVGESIVDFLEAALA